MRLVHVDVDGTTHPGTLLDDGSVALLRGLGPDAPATVTAALAELDGLTDKWAHHLDELRADTGRSIELGHLVPADAVELRAPVGERSLIVCAGGNYRAHTAEFGEAVPEKAPSFVKSSSAVIGSGQSIRLPATMPGMVDFEGEICLVFGRECHQVSADDAMSYVAGLTILNDVSARDAMNAMLTAATPVDGRWSVIEMLMGKQLPTFAPIGPAVVTTDEIPDPTDLRIVTSVNGMPMQDATTADLVVAMPELIAEMSQYYVFRPGDLLSTGTPAGVGIGHSPPVFLRPGDVVTIEVSSLGVLTNDVVPAG